MTKMLKNVVVNGASGTLGRQIVFRSGKAGRVIMSNMPRFSADRVFSPAQLEQQERFRRAAAYGKVAKALPVYVEKARGLLTSSYNVALADWFHAPEIEEVDLSAWTGEARQVIRVLALDDVEVVSVNVTIMDETDTVLEQGSATKDAMDWWTYSTSVPAPGNPKVRVTVQDLPGHSTTLTKSRN